MDYIDNSELWKCFNDSIKASRKFIITDVDKQHLTKIQIAEIKQNKEVEEIIIDTKYKDYNGKYFQGKGYVGEIDDDKIYINVLGVIDNYLSAYSSQKEGKDASLIFSYEKSLKPKLLTLKKGDDVKVIGKILSIHGPGVISLDLISIEKSGCFIATAVYNNPNAPEILVLKKIRDEHLLTNLLGKVFVKIYYKISPFLVDHISKSVLLKKILRLYFFNPIITRFKNKTYIEKIIE